MQIGEPSAEYKMSFFGNTLAVPLRSFLSTKQYYHSARWHVVKDLLTKEQLLILKIGFIDDSLFTNSASCSGLRGQILQRRFQAVRNALLKKTLDLRSNIANGRHKSS